MISYYVVEVDGHPVELRCHGSGRWGVFGPEKTEALRRFLVRKDAQDDLQDRGDAETHQRP